MTGVAEGSAPPVAGGPALSLGPFGGPLGSDIVWSAGGKPAEFQESCAAAPAGRKQKGSQNSLRPLCNLWSYKFW